MNLEWGVLIGLCTLMLTGIVYLIKGQVDVRKEAKEGRQALHDKIDRFGNRLEDTNNKLTELRAFHHVNHPNQLHGGGAFT